MKKSNKVLFVTFLLSCMIVVSACKNESAPPSNKTPETTNEAVEISNQTPEKALESYLVSISKQNINQAYDLLDPNKKPEKNLFEKSVKADKLASYKILKSEKINDTQYTVTAELKFEGGRTEIPFVLITTNDKWFISLKSASEIK